MGEPSSSKGADNKISILCYGNRFYIKRIRKMIYYLVGVGVFGMLLLCAYYFLNIYREEKERDKVQNLQAPGAARVAQRIAGQARQKEENVFYPKTYSSLPDDEKKALSNALKELPPLPSAAHQVIAEMRKETSNAQSVAQIVESDPVVVSEILRMANSAYYARREKVREVQQAIVLMGFKTIQDLILQKNLFKVFTPQNEMYDHRKLWLHSFAASLVAERLKQRAGGIEMSVSTIALLHDIGKFAMESLYPEKIRELLSNSAEYKGMDMLQKEEKILGYNHAVYGSALARAWQLPEEIYLSIENHHHPVYVSRENIPGDLLKAVTLVYIADQIVKYQGLEGDNKEVDIVTDAYFDIIGQNPPLEDLIDDKMKLLIEEAENFINRTMHG